MTKGKRQTWGIGDSVVLLLLLAVGAWMHRTALLDIWTIGTRSDEQSHILLAPFVAGWLFWLRRARLRSLRPTASLWGPALIVVGWLANWIAIENDWQVIWQAGALVTLIGCIVGVVGTQFLRRFAPAIVAMFFLIPVPGSVQHAIGIPLQAVATQVTQVILEALGIPAMREGFVLVINDEAIAVGEACNGMRMVFALVLVVYAFAFSTRLRLSVCAMLLILSPLIALACNVVRLIPTALLFGYGSATSAQAFHDLSGWVMLPVALFILLGLLRTIRWIELPIMSFRLTMQ